MREGEEGGGGEEEKGEGKVKSGRENIRSERERENRFFRLVP